METFLSSLSPRNQMPKVNLTYCPYNVHTSETFTLFTLGACEPNTAWRRNSEVGTPVATRWGCCSVRVECRQAALYKNLQDAEAELEHTLGRVGRHRCSTAHVHGGAETSLQMSLGLAPSFFYFPLSFSVPPCSHS